MKKLNEKNVEISLETPFYRGGKLKVLRDKLTKRIDELMLKRSDLMVLLTTFLLMFGAVFLVYQLQPDFYEVHIDRMNTAWGPVILTITLVLLAVKVCFLLYIVYLYLRYRSVKSVSDNELPTLTVIVPAFNEGELVYKTLSSLASSNYPKEKLQIISIDDGSKDDTWDWMLKAKNELKERLSIYQQPENRGKRHALYLGFELAKGEVFVTVDSDSIVKINTLRNLVSPFVVNPKCGAVAGNVRVLNNKNAVIPRMLNVSFVFSFEFIRSAQSVLGSVLCTPGALAAYRREAVLNCLPEWINQTFMGKSSDIGEDRAMTNMILKQGFHVVFQRNAYVLTNTPEKYKSLYKMFIRWERSNVRENIMMTKFAFTNFRKGSKMGSRVLLLNQWLKVIMAYPVMLLVLYFFVTHPILFISSTLFSIFVFSSIQVFFYTKRQKSILESVWAYPYSILYTFTLFWITPYAIITANKSGWLTR